MAFLLSHRLFSRSGLFEILDRIISGANRYSYERFLARVCVVSFILCSFASNTMVRALMAPLFLKIADKLTDQRLLARALLSVSFYASLGGLITPFGTPPNGITITNLSRASIDVTFFYWVKSAAPVAFTISLVSWILLRIMFGSSSAKINLENRQHSSNFCTLNLEQKLLITSLTVMLVLLTITDLLLVSYPIWFAVWLPLSLLFLVSSLMGKSVVTVEDFKNVPWPIIILFAGGIFLGVSLKESQLVQQLITSGFADISPLYVAAISALTSEFTSNTASASLVVPIFSQVAPSLSFVAGLASSFGFLLPTSTPTNAIDFATGYVKIRQMILAGFLLDSTGIVIIALFETFGVFKIP